MKSEKVNNRSFGILFFIVFLIIGLYPMYIGESPNKFFFILSLPFLILGLLNSKILTPFNKAWIKLGEILGYNLNLKDISELSYNMIPNKNKDLSFSKILLKISKMK